MTKAELREKVARRVVCAFDPSDCIEICKGCGLVADAAIAIISEACAEIASDYDWVGERRATGIGQIGSGVDEGNFAAGTDHAATEIARRILALTQETPDA